MAERNFYVTTPIYYVNDKPHIGHAYTTLLADVIARYRRQSGMPTFFLTGTDEHGQKVHQAARKNQRSPQQQADATVVRFQQAWEKLEITNDDFIRTTEERHKTVVRDILRNLYDRDEIYRAEYDGWYDVSSETFITPKDLPEGVDPESLPHISRIRETNYFFRMGKYQDWLVNYIEQNPAFIQPDFRRNETLGFLRKQLNDLCISRPKSRLPWGIELPFDADYVCYVWFDALVNYISTIGYLRDDERFKTWWPVDFHLIGKDILTTHTVYWPTMLKAMDVPMPRTIFAHGWWLMGDRKMSKSEGNVVNPMDMADRYGVDAVRYFLMAEMTPGQDATFTQEAFVKRYNADLANDLGNLLSRVHKMLCKHFDGCYPEPTPELLAQDAERNLWRTLRTAVDAVPPAIANMRPDSALFEILTAVRAVNRYLEIKQPWTLAKQNERQALGDTLYTAAECLRVCAALLQPVMPQKMRDLLQALGLPDKHQEQAAFKQWAVLQPSAALGSPVSLFPRAEKPKPAEAPQQKADPTDQDKNQDKINVITYDDFMKVELRTAEILAAERIKDANKLLCLQIRIGAEERQLVAGIAQHYAPDDLPGKKIVVVANLTPAKIRGVKSQGMLLAASHGDTLRLVTIDGDLPNGSRIK